MHRFNHLNLSVPDVSALADFFVRCFDFRVTESRGNGGFAVLEGPDGFILVLMHGKNEQHTTYPPFFHVGFLVSSRAEVDAIRLRAVDAGYAMPPAEVLARGGVPTYGFYHSAPGGVLVEVSTPVKAET